MGVPQVPDLVKKFTKNCITDTCSVTPFLKNFVSRADFIKSDKHRRMPLKALYELYMRWYEAELRNSEMDCERVPRIKFKEVLQMNGFEIKREARCRAKIQALRLNVHASRQLFDNDNQFEE